MPEMTQAQRNALRKIIASYNAVSLREVTEGKLDSIMERLVSDARDGTLSNRDSLMISACALALLERAP